MAAVLPPEDGRGESMVQKHRDKLQKEKEAAMLEQLRPLLPLIPDAVLRLACEEASWELESSVKLLQLFQGACQAQLEELAKVAAAEAAARSSPSSSEAEEEEAGKQSRSKSKRKHKHRKESKHKKRSKKDKPESLAVTDTFGKYGVIRENDLYSKHAEFALWAADVRKIDIGLLPKLEEKELFKDYIEDFNTGTLPHRKYYDREAYEAQRAAKAAKKGAVAGQERTAFDDESEHKRELVAERNAQQEERLRDAYNQLKYTEMDKREDMQEQDLLKQQMRLAYRTGDTERAQKLMDRLRTDEEKERLNAKLYEEGAGGDYAQGPP